MFRIEIGAGECLGRVQMRVIAALEDHRHATAEPRQKRAGPWPERHNGVLRLDHAFIRPHAPAGAGLLQRFRIAAQNAPAALLEKLGVCGDQPARLRAAPAIVPDQRAGDAALDRGIFAHAFFSPERPQAQAVSAGHRLRMRAGGVEGFRVPV